MSSIAAVKDVGRPRRIAFLVVAAAFAAFALFQSPALFFFLGWFLETEQGAVSHKVHEIAFGAIFVVAVAGLLVQVVRPERRIAPMQQVAISILALIVVLFGVTREADPAFVIFGTPTLLLLALHPARARLLRPPLRPSRLLLVLAAAIAVPLLLLSASEARIGLRAAELAEATGIADLDLPDEATEADYEAAYTAAIEAAGLPPLEQEAVQHDFHWPAMAAYGLIASLLLVLAALRPPGWRLTAWSGAGMVGSYAASSLAFPADASARSGWGVVGLAAAAAFVVVAEVLARRDRLPAAEPALATSAADPAS